MAVAWLLLALPASWQAPRALPAFVRPPCGRALGCGQPAAATVAPVRRASLRYAARAAPPPAAVTPSWGPTATSGARPLSHRLRAVAAGGGGEGGSRLPGRLGQLAAWVGASADGKEAGLRLVQLGDDFARARGEALPPDLRPHAVKVPGCVSVVRIAVTVAAGQDAQGARVVGVEGEADARVARGMLAMLAEGLRGVSVEEVRGLDVAEIIKIAKLQQFLPPGRNNGLGNMLAVIQKQAARGCEAHADEAAPAAAADDGSASPAVGAPGARGRWSATYQRRTPCPGRGRGGGAARKWPCCCREAWTLQWPWCCPAQGPGLQGNGLLPQNLARA